MEALITLAILFVSLAASHLLTDFTLKAKSTYERILAAFTWMAIFRGLSFLLAEFIADGGGPDSEWGMRLASACAGIFISALTVVRIHLNSKVQAQLPEPQAVPEQNHA